MTFSVKVVLLSILIALLGFAGPARADGGDAPDLTHQVQVLSWGKVRISSMPRVPQPSLQDLNAALRGSGWGVARVRQGQRRGVEVELVTAEPLAGQESTWELRLPIGQIADVIAPGRVVGKLRLVLPNILQADWLGAPPLAARQDKASFTTFTLDPDIATLDVALKPRPDLGRLALRAVAWALLPVAVGWLFPRWVFSRPSARDPGRLPPAYMAWVPLVMATTMPFQTIYQRWFAYWPQWYLDDRWLVAVAGFLPLLAVIVLASYPSLRIAFEVVRGSSHTRRWPPPSSG